MKEIWKDIKNYEGIYRISNKGKVISLKRKYHPKTTLLIPKIGRGGYYYICLTKNSKQSNNSLHRLLAIHFIPNPCNKPHVNHKDGDKLNNDISNLEWMTAKENAIHAHKIGLCKINKGKNSHMYKGNIEVFDKYGNNIDTLYGTIDITAKGYDQGNVYKCVVGKRKTHKGYTYRRV